MKSLFEQFDGIYRKENDYLIPNLEMPDTENFEIGIYGKQHLYFLQYYRTVTYLQVEISMSIWSRLIGRHKNIFLGL